jgi:hypothetical protein
MWAVCVVGRVEQSIYISGGPLDGHFSLSSSSFPRSLRLSLQPQIPIKSASRVSWPYQVQTWKKLIDFQPILCKQKTRLISTVPQKKTRN